MKSKQSHRLFITFLLAAIFIILSAIPNIVEAQNRQLTKPANSDKDKTKRVALVIGNGDYVNARRLSNPVNDATDMAKTLKELDFEVISGTNLNLKQMTDKVREFGDKLKVSGGVGLFYYAGHGIQVGGRNYLIPVEADILREDEIAFSSLNLNFVLQKLDAASNGLNIVVLDACRNNPFARSWSRDASDGGLAQITAPTGTFIAYATSPDRTASDGTGRNGLYTAQLLKYIKQPNLKIEEAFKQVTIAVDRTSDGKQIPWTSSSLRGEFYFTNPTASAKIPPKQQVESQPKIENEQPGDSQEDFEKAVWDKIKDSKDSNEFMQFIGTFPNSKYTPQAKLILKKLEDQPAGGKHPKRSIR